MQIAEKGHIELKLKDGDTVTIIYTEITKKGARWCLNGKWSSAKEIRDFGLLNGFHYSEGSFGIIRQNFVTRMLDDGKTLADGLQQVNGAKRLLESIRKTMTELTESKEVYEKIDSSLSLLRKRVSEEEDKKKKRGQIFEIIQQESRERDNVFRLQLGLSIVEEQRTNKQVAVTEKEIAQQTHKLETVREEIEQLRLLIEQKEADQNAADEQITVLRNALLNQQLQLNEAEQDFRAAEVSQLNLRKKLKSLTETLDHPSLIPGLMASLQTVTSDLGTSRRELSRVQQLLESIDEETKTLEVQHSASSASELIAYCTSQSASLSASLREIERDVKSRRAKLAVIEDTIIRLNVTKRRDEEEQETIQNQLINLKDRLNSQSEHGPIISEEERHTSDRLISLLELFLQSVFKDDSIGPFFKAFASLFTDSLKSSTAEKPSFIKSDMDMGDSSSSLSSSQRPEALHAISDCVENVQRWVDRSIMELREKSRTVSKNSHGNNELPTGIFGRVSDCLVFSPLGMSDEDIVEAHNFILPLSLIIASSATAVVVDSTSTAQTLMQAIKQTRRDKHQGPHSSTSPMQVFASSFFHPSFKSKVKLWPLTDIEMKADPQTPTSSIFSTLVSPFSLIQPVAQSFVPVVRKIFAGTRLERDEQRAIQAMKSIDSSKFSKTTSFSPHFDPFSSSNDDDRSERGSGIKQIATSSGTLHSAGFLSGGFRKQASTVLYLTPLSLSRHGSQLSTFLGVSRSLALTIKSTGEGTVTFTAKCWEGYLSQIRTMVLDPLSKLIRGLVTKCETRRKVVQQREQIMSEITSWRRKEKDVEQRLFDIESKMKSLLDESGRQRRGIESEEKRGDDAKHELLALEHRLELLSSEKASVSSFLEESKRGLQIRKANIEQDEQRIRTTIQTLEAEEEGLTERIEQEQEEQDKLKEEFEKVTEQLRRREDKGRLQEMQKKLNDERVRFTQKEGELKALLSQHRGVEEEREHESKREEKKQKERQELEDNRVLAELQSKLVTQQQSLQIRCSHRKRKEMLAKRSRRNEVIHDFPLQQEERNEENEWNEPDQPEAINREMVADEQRAERRQRLLITDSELQRIENTGSDSIEAEIRQGEKRGKELRKARNDLLAELKVPNTAEGKKSRRRSGKGRRKTEWSDEDSSDGVDHLSSPASNNDVQEQDSDAQELATVKRWLEEEQRKETNTSDEVMTLLSRLDQVRTAIERLEENIKDSKQLVLRANRIGLLRLNRSTSTLFSSLFVTKEVRLIIGHWIEKKKGKNAENGKPVRQTKKQRNKQKKKKSASETEDFDGESSIETEIEEDFGNSEGNLSNHQPDDVPSPLSPKSDYSQDEEFDDALFSSKAKDPANFALDGGIEIQIRDRMENGEVSDWRRGLEEMSGGQRTLLSLCIVVCLAQFGHENKAGKGDRVDDDEATQRKRRKGKSLVLFDEIDSNLDEHNQALLARLLTHSFANTQVICVSHLPTTTTIADCIISLDRAQHHMSKKDNTGGKRLAHDTTYVSKVTLRDKQQAEIDSHEP
ncbi:hypothetical protein BLNAU_369 [Blattamonas nauphoetae]|uniref:RecF/RecN/SMC N-terminal domain-containing protein n=1 Tax=Blattamonas nauphoetae TaxID=2049346 RepID=A0ABQ9YL17_9EUKA|nr:hypothetical protein BLNAU_369 [Blattamonas nauphoetae]